ncbi:MAG: potassium channel family protein [Acidimicrobiia bacterium]
MRRLVDALFDDSGDKLDRFGLLFILSVLSVTLNSVVDIDDPTQSIAAEVAWVATTLIVGATLIVAMRSSGVARRPLKYATIGVVFVAVTAVVVSLFSGVEELSTASGRPSIIWVVLAGLSPFFVTRRLFLQDRVTAGTIFGALAAFLLIALAFDYVFLSLDQWVSPVFAQPEPTSSFMYFSLVTITTLGYGDLSPVSEWARYFATAEAVIGTIFLVTVVARLVAMFGTDQALLPHRHAASGESDSEAAAGMESDTP